jgi:hypothetical protein
MHEALMSTSTPPSGCKLGLIPGVIMPLQITEKRTQINGANVRLAKEKNFLFHAISSE